MPLGATKEKQKFASKTPVTKTIKVFVMHFLKNLRLRQYVHSNGQKYWDTPLNYYIQVLTLCIVILNKYF